MLQMNDKYLFDTIMECIGSKITGSRNSALRAIAKTTTYNIKNIKAFFLLTTGNALEWYYRQRRLYTMMIKVVSMLAASDNTRIHPKIFIGINVYALIIV